MSFTKWYLRRCLLQGGTPRSRPAARSRRRAGSCTGSRSPTPRPPGAAPNNNNINDNNDDNNNNNNIVINDNNHHHHHDHHYHNDNNNNNNDNNNNNHYHNDNNNHNYDHNDNKHRVARRRQARRAERAAGAGAHDDEVPRGRLRQSL